MHVRQLSYQEVLGDSGDISAAAKQRLLYDAVFEHIHLNG